MKYKLLLVTGIAVIGAWVVSARENDSAEAQVVAASVASADWLTDFRAGQERARAENKLLLVDFTGSDWCPPCMMLEKQVFSQSEFANYAARNLVLVKIDFPRRKPLPPAQQAANDELARQFGIRGFPTILVMGPDGKTKGQLGYIFGGPAKFISKLEQLGGKS
jgi:protein disulfide-isomerase